MRKAAFRFTFLLSAAGLVASCAARETELAHGSGPEMGKVLGAAFTCGIRHVRTEPLGGDHERLILLPGNSNGSIECTTKWLRDQSLNDHSRNPQ